MTEAGIKDYNAVAWLRIVAPSGTPLISSRPLDAAVKAALASRNLVERGEKPAGS